MIITFTLPVFNMLTFVIKLSNGVQILHCVHDDKYINADEQCPPLQDWFRATGFFCHQLDSK